jgi:pimeloyl-ACP methyl ester carboxylesterase
MRAIRLSLGIDIRLHDLAGDGPPLVFIHGLGCSSSCDFVAVARAPALRGRRILLVDLLGYGYSDKPASFSYGVDAHASVVCELLGLLEIGQADLFGHSMGGAIAITVATRRRKLLRRMVLSEPNLDSGGGVFSRSIAARTEQDYISSGHAADIRDAVASGYTAWAGSMAVASPLAVHRDSTSLVQGTDPSWRTQLLGLPGFPRTVLFGERTLPDNDHVLLPAHDIDVDVVPAAGHSMATDNPSGLAIAIARALGA